MILITNNVFFFAAAVILLKLLTQMQGENADRIFPHRSLVAKMYTNTGYIWLN